MLIIILHTVNNQSSLTLHHYLFVEWRLLLSVVLLLELFSLSNDAVCSSWSVVCSVHLGLFRCQFTDKVVHLYIVARLSQVLFSQLDCLMRRNCCQSYVGSAFSRHEQLMLRTSWPYFFLACNCYRQQHRLVEAWLLTVFQVDLPLDRKVYQTLVSPQFPMYAHDCFYQLPLLFRHSNPVLHA